MLAAVLVSDLKNSLQRLNVPPGGIRTVTRELPCTCSIFDKMSNASDTFIAYTLFFSKVKIVN
jgi:hypothetical protein